MELRSVREVAVLSGILLAHGGVQAHLDLDLGTFRPRSTTTRTLEVNNE